MSKESNNFYPEWNESPPPEKSYRSVFKWGDPKAYKHPNQHLYEMLKETFSLTDNDFIRRQEEGLETVKVDQKIKLSKTDLKNFQEIVGKDNVAEDDYSRVKYANGKTVEEAMSLRKGICGPLADIVIHPRHKEDVQEIVAYCHKKKIPIYVYGGGSSVNFGLRPLKGGVTLVMNTHMNKIIKINELNQTVTVQAGMMGPAYEEILNKAPQEFNTAWSYTGGHFPQSFEYSSIGGWVVTLGSGQQSSYYGDAYDLVISQEYVTPQGTIKTLDYPATATGPKVNDIFKGSEGCFGVLVELKMKIFRYLPQNKQKFAFIFPTWEKAVEAGREVSQGEFGFPSVFRISDAEETDVALKLYGIEGTIIDKFINFKGYKPKERCLLIGQADGEKSFAKNVKKQIKKICKKYGALYITGYPVKNWEEGRYKDPYLREDLHDYGVLIDTLESGVSWDNLHNLHQGVREFVKSNPGAICMTHASHFYSQGTNLYFIFIIKTSDIKEYKRIQDGVIDMIAKHGGSLSHHHGVGKMIAPWIEKHLGAEQMAVLRSLKKHFDPNNIMNPGGQLGLG